MFAVPINLMFQTRISLKKRVPQTDE